MSPTTTGCKKHVLHTYIYSLIFPSLSLAEIDKTVHELYPEMDKHKPALMRAYKSSDVNGDGFVKRDEFAKLLYFLAYYDTLYQKFKNVDSDGDRRLDFAEFKKAHQLLGLPGDEAALKKEFQSMDKNGGGKVLFDEFCMYYASQMTAPTGGSPESPTTGKKRGLAGLFGGGQPQEAKPQPASNGKAAPKAAASPAKSASKGAAPANGTARPKSGKSLPSDKELFPAKLSVDMKITPEQLDQMFRRFDVTNNNGILSLAEIDKTILEIYPEMAKHKPALMRAYKAADKDGSGFVEKPEFGQLLFFLAYYDQVHAVFRSADTDGDKRMTFDEFKANASKLGFSNAKEAELRKVFDEIDENGGGMVLFDEFCLYMGKKRTDQVLHQETAKPAAKAAAKPVARASPGAKAAPASKPAAPAAVAPKRTSSATPKASTSKTGDLPAKLTMDMKLTTEQINSGFKRFDVTNNNGILSLAEIDKSMFELYPEMGKHKPALMRAYKAADQDGSGFIEKREFAELLYFLAFYDGLFEYFADADADGDKRMTFDEFKRAAAKLGFSSRSEADLRKMFEEMDDNGGGLVLFDEFCVYMAKQRVGQLPAFASRATINTTGAKKVPAATSRATKATTTARSPSSSARPVSSGRPTSQGEGGFSSSGLDGATLDRKLRFAETENRRLELQIAALREQVESMGGVVDDKKVHRYSTSLDSYATQINQLNDKLNTERQRYNAMRCWLPRKSTA